MPLATALTRLRAATCAAAAAAFFCAAPASAQTEKPNDVYVGAVETAGSPPYLVYIYADSNVSALKELRTIALYPNPDYKGEENVESGQPRFDARKGCAIALDYSIEKAKAAGTFKIAEKPIYGPNSQQAPIDPASLPSFMAREGVKQLLERKLVADEGKAVAHFNCASWLWSKELSQPPQFWDELYKGLVDEKSKN